MTFEEKCRAVILGQEKVSFQYNSRPTVGERFEVPRKDKEPVRVLLHSPAGKGPFPVLLNMHGGGFSGLDAVMMDDFCQMICERLNVFVINVNYRLSPAVAYPYAIEEVVDTAAYFMEKAEEYRLDVNLFGVCGSSAGGSIAAGAALMARDRGIWLSCQVLIYPCTDLYTDPDPGDPYADPGLVEAYKDMAKMYCQHNDSSSLYASPVLASSDRLAACCPAVFVICEKDTLRPQGEAYAKKLIDAGVPVSLKRFTGSVHGFLEVNRESFFFPDDRKTPEQDTLAREAENYIYGQLKAIWG